MKNTALFSIPFVLLIVDKKTIVEEKAMEKTHTLSNKRPELKWIPIAEMFVDDSYQRTPESKASKKNIVSIRDNFAWEYCGALIVCWNEEKGKYAIIDGQHRWIAAGQRGDITDMPCIILQDADIQTQATTFAAINTRRVALNTLAMFHASVGAGVPEAVKAAKVLKDCNIEIPRGPVVNGQTGPRQMQSPGTLIKLLAKYSSDSVAFALNIIPEAYGEAKACLRSSIIKALAEFHKRRPDHEHDIVVRALRKHSVLQLEKQARNHYDVSQRLPVVMLIAERILSEYDKLAKQPSEKPATSYSASPQPTPVNSKPAAPEQDDDWGSTPPPPKAIHVQPVRVKEEWAGDVIADSSANKKPAGPTKPSKAIVGAPRPEKEPVVGRVDPLWEKAQTQPRFDAENIVPHGDF